MDFIPVKGFHKEIASKQATQGGRFICPAWHDSPAKTDEPSPRDFMKKKRPELSLIN